MVVVRPAARVSAEPSVPTNVRAGHNAAALFLSTAIICFSSHLLKKTSPHWGEKDTVYVRNGYVGITVLVLRRQTFFPAYIFGGCRESCPSTAFFPPGGPNNTSPPTSNSLSRKRKETVIKGKKRGYHHSTGFYGSFWGERCTERRRISLTTTTEAPE